MISLVMFNLEFSSDFIKKYKKINKKDPILIKKVDKALKHLSQNPKYPGLNSHEIKHQKLGRVWTSWSAPDLRILWKYQDDKLTLLLIKIGNHNEVY